jgi:two-component system sensor histidine kinase DesK
MKILDDETCWQSEPEPALEWIAKHPGPWFALAWAPVLLIAPLIDAIAGREPFRAVFLLVVGVVFAGTVCVPFRVRRSHRWWAEIAFAALLALCTLHLVLFNADRGFLFPLLAIAAALAVRQHGALSLISALAISGAFAAGAGEGSLDAAVFLGFATFMAGTGTFLVQYLVGVIADLTEARERLAESAVAEERLRFSRDLHDLLGHTLSVIVVKAEAIRRLLRLDVRAAEAHAGDIETIGRKALTEVREAVTGYRSVSYREELANARAALSAAGIRLSVSQLPSGLSASVDSLLGWIVREGTTNVLRHADAQRCTISITVTSDEEAVRIDVADDGTATKATLPLVLGSGLLGLRERVQALGGELLASPTDSGFRLSASLPARALSGTR